MSVDLAHFKFVKPNKVPRNKLGKKKINNKLTKMLLEIGRIPVGEDGHVPIEDRYEDDFLYSISDDSCKYECIYNKKTKRTKYKHYCYSSGNFKTIDYVNVIQCKGSLIKYLSNFVDNLTGESLSKLGYIVNELEKMPNSTRKSIYMLDMALAGTHCQSRRLGTVNNIFNDLYGEMVIPSTFQGQLDRSLMYLREKIIKSAFLKNCPTNETGHCQAYWVNRLCDLLGIASHKKVKIQYAEEQFIGKDINLTDQQSVTRVLNQYTYQTIKDHINTALFDKQGMKPQELIDWGRFYGWLRTQSIEAVDVLNDSCDKITDYGFDLIFNKLPGYIKFSRRPAVSGKSARPIGKPTRPARPPNKPARPSNKKKTRTSVSLVYKKMKKKGVSGFEAEYKDAKAGWERVEKGGTDANLFYTEDVELHKAYVASQVLAQELNEMLDDEEVDLETHNAAKDSTERMEELMGESDLKFEKKEVVKVAKPQKPVVLKKPSVKGRKTAKGRKKPTRPSGKPTKPSKPVGKSGKTRSASAQQIRCGKLTKKGKPCKIIVTNKPCRYHGNS